MNLPSDDFVRRVWDAALADSSGLSSFLNGLRAAAPAPAVNPFGAHLDIPENVRDAFAKVGLALRSSGPGQTAKIAAIKVVREMFKCGLKEAKDTVELILPSGFGLAWPKDADPYKPPYGY